MGQQAQEKRKMFKEFAGQKAEKRIALGPAEDRKDIMTYILRHNEPEKGMTHSEIVQNGRLLIAAGSETTASALSGLTFYLTRTPHAYSRLTKEIRSAFRSEDEIGIRSTARLHYLNACLEEGLRVYPPVAETPPRISPGDTIAGHYIPAGTIISVYQWAAYHSEENFCEPDSFNPERWLPQDHPYYDDRFSTDNKAAFKPFSTGSRDCIGKNLAYAEMRLIMSRLLLNFDLELVKGYEHWDETQRIYFIWEKGPLMIKLTPVRKDAAFRN
ncbi:cytochrome P450 [Aspergillus melleus]|uniref:cytochrome P450 n=1 Tax=Aspergillus melleus TaxID=138277 RepID=UPI001E8EAE0B|nr:uncharacterized protein LDX57_007850 [Aspergillus melleus]KAH8430180.1 hypothetical protein LDX57_007850 [Aspergillus melleus]